MDNSSKPLTFNGTAGGFFLANIALVFLTWIPFVGGIIGFNYYNKWMAENCTINGHKVTYKATMWEVFKFTFFKGLLVFVTAGIYIFWYVPKLYGFVADHVFYTDIANAAPAPPTPAGPTPNPITPAQPSIATDPTQSTDPPTPVS